jgi:hypothetical protein
VSSSSAGLLLLLLLLQYSVCSSSGVAGIVYHLLLLQWQQLQCGASTHTSRACVLLLLHYYSSSSNSSSNYRGSHWVSYAFRRGTVLGEGGTTADNGWIDSNNGSQKAVGTRIAVYPCTRASRLLLFAGAVVAAAAVHSVCSARVCECMCVQYNLSGRAYTTCAT